MTARIDSGNANRKRPQTKLAIALPLVCAGKIVPSAGGPNAGAGAEAAETSFPQTAQNLSPTGTLFPQPEQNTTISLPKLRSIGDALSKLSETVLLGLSLVNLLAWVTHHDLPIGKSAI